MIYCQLPKELLHKLGSIVTPEFQVNLTNTFILLFDFHYAHKLLVLINFLPIRIIMIVILIILILIIIITIVTVI